VLGQGNAYADGEAGETDATAGMPPGDGAGSRSTSRAEGDRETRAVTGEMRIGL
jgi:hypothetical protein